MRSIPIRVDIISMHLTLKSPIVHSRTWTAALLHVWLITRVCVTNENVFTGICNTC